MRHRFLISAAVLAVAVGLMPLAVVSVAGQAPAGAPGTYTPPPSTYNPPRTPWGDPDIQGTWDYQSIVPMQRPQALAGKTALTEAEWADFAKNNDRNQDACGVGTRENEECSPEELASVGAYNEFWDNRNIIRDLRTSLIVDPADGRIAPMTPEARKRQTEVTGNRGPGRSQYETWEDFPTITRCIAEQTPNGPQMYNSGVVLMQSPGWVVMFRERLDTRIIALDGRPHVDDSIRLWHGDSRGHWEGNTLVVETTNFNGRQLRGGVGSTIPAGVSLTNMNLVERFVPVSANRLHYYATITDATTWTRPWTFMLPWEKDPSYIVYEYACHEANISVGNALQGERALEEQAPKKAAMPADQTSAGLMGASEATVRAKLGEPAAIVQRRWTYEMVGGGHVLHVFFGDGKVTIVQPNDLPLDQVRRR